MEARLAAAETSQPERSREASDEQPENREARLVAEETSQPVRSREASDEQPSNIPSKREMPETSRPDRSSDLGAADKTKAFNSLPADLPTQPETPG